MRGMRRALALFTRCFFLWVSVFVVLLMVGIFTQPLPIQPGVMTGTAQAAAWLAVAVTLITIFVFEKRRGQR